MKRLLALFLPSLLLGCSSAPSITSYLTPYRIDVRQGNMVTQEMVAQLKPGLSKDQVRFILGTPLVADMFHANRWDYIYRFRPGRDHNDVLQRRLIVYFEEGKLARLEGDVVANVVANEKGAATETPVKPVSRVIDIPPSGGATKVEPKPDAVPVVASPPTSSDK